MMGRKHWGTTRGDTTLVCYKGFLTQKYKYNGQKAKRKMNQDMSWHVLGMGSSEVEAGECQLNTFILPCNKGVDALTWVVLVVLNDWGGKRAVLGSVRTAYKHSITLCWRSERDIFQVKRESEEKLVNNMATSLSTQQERTRQGKV